MIQQNIQDLYITALQWMIVCAIIAFCGIIGWYKTFQLKKELQKPRSVVVTCPFCGANLNHKIEGEP
jgi:predicted negative regulator of RcsB-dependent stress response